MLLLGAAAQLRRIRDIHPCETFEKITRGESAGRPIRRGMQAQRWADIRSLE